MDYFKAFRKLQTLDSLIKYRDYRFLWTANFCSNNAQWLQLLTLGWLVREISYGSATSPLQVITVGGLSTIPVLIVGPWAGVLADRVDRAKLFIVVHILMTIAAGLFAFMVHADQIQESWQVYVYVLFGGTARAIIQPIQQVLVANTVDEKDVGNAYATNVLTIAGTRMIGPFIGGILIYNMGFTWNFIIEAIMYVGVVAAIFPMKTPYGNKKIAHHGSPLQDIKQAIRFIRTDQRVLLSLIILSLIPDVLLHPLYFLLPIFTSDVLGKGTDFGGYLLAITGLGGLLVALMISSFGFLFKKGMIVLWTPLASAIFTILFAQSEWLLTSFIFLLVMSMAQAYFRTTNGTLVLMLCPDNLRGRVTSIQRYSQGLLPLTSLFIGVFAWQSDVQIAMSSIGLVAVLFSVICFFRFHLVKNL